MILATTLAAGLGPATADGDGTQSSRPPAGAAAIRVVLRGGETIEFSLLENATAVDLLSLLPLKVTLTDYFSTEKIADLPRRLSTTDAPEGFHPAVGDLAYYAPWGNLAIFHKSFRYSPELVRLGTVSGAGIERLAAPGPVDATIEKVD